MGVTVVTADVAPVLKSAQLPTFAESIVTYMSEVSCGVALSS